jgi:hypothetical protein
LTFGGGEVRSGEVGAGPIGFGWSEIGVEGQGVFVVEAREGRAAEDVVGVAKAGVGTGLLVAVAAPYRTAMSSSVSPYSPKVLSSRNASHRL